MAFSVTRSFDRATESYAVTVKVALSLAETSSLFLSGDSMVSWPEAALLDGPDLEQTGAREGGEAALVRTGMFVSELARLAQGLKIGYRQVAEAERAAQLLRLQLLRAGIEEET
jgi:hypothetical protein